MFLKKSSIDEVITGLQTNLNKIAEAPRLAQQDRKASGLRHLISAAEIFEDLGLSAQANSVTLVLEKIALESDPATQGLSSEKMLSNLEDKGWVFNANDGDIIDVEEPSSSDDAIVMDQEGQLEVVDDGLNANASFEYGDEYLVEDLTSRLTQNNSRLNKKKD